MSYGKIFSSAFTGSLVGSGPVVFAVWSYVIAHTVDSQVEINPILVAAVLGCPAEDVKSAIAKLTAPDPQSRNKDHEGRRLLKEGEYAYRVVSHKIYREMRNEDDRRAYNREKKRESRARSKASMTVFDKSAVSAQAETETRSRDRDKSPTATTPPSPAPDSSIFDKPNPPRKPLGTRSFSDWRIAVGRRIYWSREEDEAWKAMYEAEGWDEMTRGYNHLAKKKAEPAKIFLSDFQGIR